MPRSKRPHSASAAPPKVDPLRAPPSPSVNGRDLAKEFDALKERVDFLETLVVPVYQGITKSA